MREHLDETPFTGDDEPSDLEGIYGTGASGRPHGIKPDYAIRNAQNGRIVFVEIKRQGAAGNAHERACKYMMPGILNAMRQVGNQPDSVIPMWWVFTNGLAEAQRYEREIMFWFQGIERHVLLWGDRRADVTEHFDRFIRPMLE